MSNVELCCTERTHTFNGAQMTCACGTTRRAETALERIDALHSSAALRGIEFQCSLSDYVVHGSVVCLRSPANVIQVVSRVSLTSDQIITAISDFVAEEQKQQATLVRETPCPNCAGTGSVRVLNGSNEDLGRCPWCGGSGVARKLQGVGP